MPDAHRVVLVENDPDFVCLIRQAIDRCGALSFLAAASRGKEGIVLAQKLRPHVLLMGLGLPGGMDGVAAARAIRLTTEACVLLLTSCEDAETIISASKQAFASGYVFKAQCQTLVASICRTAETSTPQAAFIKALVLSELFSAERGIVEMLLKANLATSSTEQTIANQNYGPFDRAKAVYNERMWARSKKNSSCRTRPTEHAGMVASIRHERARRTTRRHDFRECPNRRGNWQTQNSSGIR